MSGRYRYYRRKKYYSPKQKEYYAMKLAKKSSSVAKNAEKSVIKRAQREGQYQPNILQFMQNVNVYHINGRIVFLEFNNLAYFGRKAYKTLLSQAYYSGMTSKPKKAINQAVDNLVTAINAQMEENRQNRQAEQNRQDNQNEKLPKPSFGIIPHTDTTITFLMRRGSQRVNTLENILQINSMQRVTYQQINSVMEYEDDFLLYLVSFFMYNLSGINPDTIGNYLPDDLANAFVAYKQFAYKTKGMSLQLGRLLMNELRLSQWTPEFPKGYNSWFTTQTAGVAPQVTMPQEQYDRYVNNAMGNDNDNDNY